MRSESDAYEYDVVLSFAGEDRSYVEQVAELLRVASVKVFYDEYEQAALWGKDLYEHLDEVYRRKGRYCVMFISRAYKGKVWTNHERRGAQARAFQESEEYILPARFDDTEIPGIRPTIGYVDLRRMPPAQLANLILEKLGRGGSSQRSDDGGHRQHRVPRRAHRALNPYEEALRFMSQLVAELKQRCDALGEEGVSASSFDREGRKCLRVVVDGNTVYSLDVSLGGLGGDSSLQFHGVPGEARHSGGSFNAWGDMVWDKEHERPALDFHDFSLLGHLGEKRFSPQEFIEALWERICNAIEEAE